MLHSIDLVGVLTHAHFVYSSSSSVSSGSSAGGGSGSGSSSPARNTTQREGSFSHSTEADLDGQEGDDGDRHRP